MYININIKYLYKNYNSVKMKQLGLVLWFYIEIPRWQRYSKCDDWGTFNWNFRTANKEQLFCRINLILISSYLLIVNSSFGKYYPVKCDIQSSKDTEESRFDSSMQVLVFQLLVQWHWSPGSFWMYFKTVNRWDQTNIFMLLFYTIPDYGTEFFS